MDSLQSESVSGSSALFHLPSIKGPHLPSGIDLDAFLPKSGILNFIDIDDDDDINVHLESIDVLELYTALDTSKQSLAMLKLENIILRNFLERYDPRLSTNLRSSVRATLRDRFSTISTSPMSRRRSQASIFSSRQSMFERRKSSVIEYHVNNHTKAEMAERASNEVEIRLHQYEQTSLKQMRDLHVHTEELKNTSEELDQTACNFELHFLLSPQDIAFMKNATEREIARELRAFVQSWLKNGEALISNLRMRLSDIRINCHHVRDELIIKQDLSGVLQPVDFMKLRIKRDYLARVYEEKTLNLFELTRVVGRAALTRTDKKTLLTNLEASSKKLANEIVKAQKTIEKYVVERKEAELANLKYAEKIESLRLQLQLYESPSVESYMNNKQELNRLEKKQNALQRKLRLGIMTLENVKRQCKRT